MSDRRGGQCTEARLHRLRDGGRTSRCDGADRRRGERGLDRGGDRVAEGLGMIGPSGTARLHRACLPQHLERWQRGLRPVGVAASGRAAPRVHGHVHHSRDLT